MDFFGKVLSLLFNMLFRFGTASTFPPYICHEVIGPDTMILVFWMLSFKPAFSLSSFTLINKLFSSSSFSAIKVEWYHLHIWSCWYFSWKSWFQLVMHPTWHFTRYILHKLNKQGDSIQLSHSFPNFEPIVLCPVLTVASWPAYGFLRRQVRWSGTLISLRIFHNLLWSTQSKEEWF